MRILISPDEPRLRAGWRLLLQTILQLILSVGLSLPIIFFVSAVQVSQLGAVNTLFTLVSAVAVVISVWLARRFLDRRSFRSLGLRMNRLAIRDVLVGFAIPLLLMGLIYVVFSGLGWLRFENWAWEVDTLGGIANGLFLSLLTFVIVGFYEELLSRGYHLQNIADGMNLAWGIFLSSAVFAILHLGNPNASWMSALGILAAGYFLAYGWVRTRQLWLPIGLHIGLNFFEGTIYGFPVSGLETFRLLRHTITGPTLITGGEFGPEAGLIVLPAMALGAGLIYLYTRGRLEAEPSAANTPTEPDEIKHAQEPSSRDESEGS
jgi:membrane protease YdiL (CAAX protease family)